ncbi:hypothetical protein Mal65_15900 [Crateriforma conspicua]|nr:hypothetical protein Mal65_15900 [Crateriforma conspicua]
MGSSLGLKPIQSVANCNAVAFQSLTSVRLGTSKEFPGLTRKTERFQNWQSSILLHEVFGILLIVEMLVFNGQRNVASTFGSLLKHLDARFSNINP